jgi:hypothetical protein
VTYYVKDFDLTIKIPENYTFITSKWNVDCSSIADNFQNGVSCESGAKVDTESIKLVSKDYLDAEYAISIKVDITGVGYSCEPMNNEKFKLNGMSFTGELCGPMDPAITGTKYVYGMVAPITLSKDSVYKKAVINLKAKDKSMVTDMESVLSQIKFGK